MLQEQIRQGFPPPKFRAIRYYDHSTEHVNHKNKTCIKFPHMIYDVYHSMHKIIIIKVSCGFNFVVLRLSVPLEHCLDQC